MAVPPEESSIRVMLSSAFHAHVVGCYVFRTRDFVNPAIQVLHGDLLLSECLPFTDYPGTIKRVRAQLLQENGAREKNIVIFAAVNNVSSSDLYLLCNLPDVSVRFFHR